MSREPIAKMMLLWVVTILLSAGNTLAEPVKTRVHVANVQIVLVKVSDDADAIFASILILDSDGNRVESAVVRGEFSGAVSESGTSSPAISGRCYVHALARIPRNNAKSSAFTVSDIVGEGIAYDRGSDVPTQKMIRLQDTIKWVRDTGRKQPVRAYVMRALGFDNRDYPLIRRGFIADSDKLVHIFAGLESDNALFLMIHINNDSEGLYWLFSERGEILATARVVHSGTASPEDNLKNAELFAAELDYFFGKTGSPRSK